MTYFWHELGGWWVGRATAENSPYYAVRGPFKTYAECLAAWLAGPQRIAA